MHQRISSPHSQGKAWLLQNVMKISTELYCYSNISVVTLQCSWSVKGKICEVRKHHYIEGKGSWLQSHLMLNIRWDCIIPFTLVLREGAQRAKAMLQCSSNLIVTEILEVLSVWQWSRQLNRMNCWQPWEKTGCSQEERRLAFIATPLASAEQYRIRGKRASRLW